MYNKQKYFEKLDHIHYLVFLLFNLLLAFWNNTDLAT
jgi:hypothetical protein